MPSTPGSSVRPPAPRRKCSAFTLLELMVTIGIIVILIGILIPVYAKVKKASYAVQTKNTLSNLANAITNYHATYGAYPGYFSDNDVEAGLVVDTNSNALTTSENLAISLCGGIAAGNTGATPPQIVAVSPNDTAVGTRKITVTFDPKVVGQGPLSDNFSNPRRLSPMFDASYGPGSALSYSQNMGAPAVFTDEGGHTAGDSIFPEFIDQYPNALPILYLRAHVSSNGIVSKQSAGFTTTHSNYELADITPYTASHIGRTDNTAMSHGLVGLDTSNSTSPNSSPAPTLAGEFPNNAILYFGDPNGPPAMATFSSWATYNPVSTTTPYTGGVARAKDTYILISAGPDRTYGTADDIVSFGGTIQDVGQ